MVEFAIGGVGRVPADAVLPEGALPIDIGLDPRPTFGVDRLEPDELLSWREAGAARVRPCHDLDARGLGKACIYPFGHGLSPIRIAHVGGL